MWVGGDDEEGSIFVTGEAAGGADLVVEIEKSDDVDEGEEDADGDDKRSP